jgi:oligoendopeptidase F
MLQSKELCKNETGPKKRSEVAEKDRWNVAALYGSPDVWLGELKAVQDSPSKPYWPKWDSFRGKLADSELLADFLRGYLSIDRTLSKLHTYAHLRHDEDVANDQSKHNYGLISALYHEFQLEASWFEPELLALSEEAFQKHLAHPKLKSYRTFLQKIGRMRSHTLSPQMEALMALSGRALDTASHAFSALQNGDLVFEQAIDSAGKTHALTNGTYLSYMRSSDRELRKTAFQNLHKTFDAHANCLCELIQGQVQGHLYHARARGYASCLEAALYPHAVEPSVYRNLIAAVRKHLPLMHEYIRLRKQTMGLSELHMYDLHVPLVADVKMDMAYPDACRTVVEAVAPLGSAYQNALKKGLLEDRWVDVFENVGKRSGAYSSGCYDSMPYILMNYHGTFNDVITLAHEAGHSMHSYYSRQGQSYVDSHYSIFVAEVASTFNEQLLVQMMKAKVKSEREKAYLINDEIERIRNTIFRQTMFAEFELKIHEWIEEGVPLTPTLLKEYYASLNRDYYGPDVVIDPETAIEWARIPHFYYNFYVYQYATGLSAAIALHQKAIASIDARDRYLDFLSSGGSEFPLDQLAKAGIDMRTSQPVEEALDWFGKLVHALKKSLLAI